ncbi:Suppressor of mec-8 and unc-52 protein-like protein 2 [Nymphaea thermarum]|nr:Suppressor of mec-8 and unc-52 protein-like protein 2 [Nymphaea thermarum]
MVREEKQDEPELPKYRDRAKERREDQNPDYEPTELGSFHAVAPPGTVDLRSADAHKISIENSKYLGGDVEHTHLVKGLDYALLHKVRSEIDKRPEVAGEEDGKSKGSKEDQPLSFRSATTKSVYQWIVKPQSAIKANEMFLPGRMSFVFSIRDLNGFGREEKIGRGGTQRADAKSLDTGYSSPTILLFDLTTASSHHNRSIQEDKFSPDIPTTLHRSKDDCPVPQEMVTVSVDGSVLERIAKIMSYLRLGSSGKVLKKKKKEKDRTELKAKFGAAVNEDEENENALHHENGVSVHKAERELLPPPPPRKNHATAGDIQTIVVSRVEEDDIFIGDGVNYAIPGNDTGASPVSEDMEESPRNRERPSYFAQPEYGPVPPEPIQDWQQMNGYGAVPGPALASGYQGEWQDYQYAEQMAYPDHYVQQPLPSYDTQASAVVNQDPQFMTQEEKDRGLGSVFKRDDRRLQQLREKDAREKDPNFISESYSECYPGYQEYNHEIVDSDDEADLTKMDMGGRAKGRLHRWDFETEEEWATYNEQKEAMPKAAFQFGVKMQDGRKTRKQNKEQKLTNELHKINKLLAKKMAEKGGTYDDGEQHYDDVRTSKKLRI